MEEVDNESDGVDEDDEDVEDVEEMEDPMDAVKVNGQIRFVGTPVYGIVEIETIQALVDGWDG